MPRESRGRRVGFGASLTQVEAGVGDLRRSRESRGGRWVWGLVDASGEPGWASFTRIERWALAICVVHANGEAGVGFGASLTQVESWGGPRSPRWRGGRWRFASFTRIERQALGLGPR